MPYRQTNSLQEVTQVIRNKFLISRFPEISASYSQFPEGPNARFAPPADTHVHREPTETISGFRGFTLIKYAKLLDKICIDIAS